MPQVVPRIHMDSHGVLKASLRHSQLQVLSATWINVKLQLVSLRHELD